MRLISKCKIEQNFEKHIAKLRNSIILGLAYALLANCDAISGIYTAFFPVIIYIILGTSRHVSMGEKNF